MSTSSQSSGGIGFIGLLTLIFVTLKLCKVIDWSWWWVLSPSIIGGCIGLIFAIILILLIILKGRR